MAVTLARVPVPLGVPLALGVAPKLRLAVCVALTERVALGVTGSGRPATLAGSTRDGIAPATPGA